MNRRMLRRFTFGLALVLGACVLLVLIHRQLLRLSLEHALNRETEPLFHGSIRLRDARIDSSLRLQINHIHADLTTAGGRVPLVVDHVRSQQSVIRSLLERRLTLIFDGARFEQSPLRGVTGVAELRRNPNWRLELQVGIQGIGLQDLERFSPEYLTGSTGTMTGDLGLRYGAREDTFLSLDLRIAEPGGLVPSRFLQLLVPYLPNASEIRKLSSKTALVGYHTASLQLFLPQSDQLKVLMQMAIPEYNLQLNLNVEVRVDERNILLQLAHLLGLLHPT